MLFVLFNNILYYCTINNKPMKFKLLLILFILPLLMFGTNPKDKKVLKEKSNDIIKVESYIKSLKLKTKKTVNC